MLIRSTLRTTGGSLTTTVPAEVAQRMGAVPGQALNWIEEEPGRFAVELAKSDSIMEAADRVLERYRPAFAALAIEDSR